MYYVHTSIHKRYTPQLSSNNCYNIIMNWYIYIYLAIDLESNNNNEKEISTVAFPFEVFFLFFFFLEKILQFDLEPKLLLPID